MLVTNEKTVLSNTLISKLISAVLIIISISLFTIIPVLENPFDSNDFYGRSVLKVAPEISLKNANNQIVNITDFKGNFVYLMFGYLNCDKVCHSQVFTLNTLNQVLQTEDIEFVYVGMDPERDTAKQISQYFDAINPNFTGLVAQNMLQAQNIAASYHAYFNKEPLQNNSNYSINHPGFIYLIDPKGNLRVVYSGNALNISLMASDFHTIENEFSSI